MKTSSTAKHGGVSIVGLTDDTRLSILRVDELTNDAVWCLIGTVPIGIVNAVHTGHVIAVLMAHAVVRRPTELSDLLGLDALPSERCARHQEHIVLRTVDGVLAHDTEIRLNVTNHHIALRTVNGTGIAVDVVTVVELLKDVENLAFRTATRQRRTNQARIEQREHTLTSESALFVILVRPVAECRT